MTAEQMISAAYGSIPVATGAGEKTVNCYAFEAWEDTVIASFKDKNGAAKVTGWETIAIPEGRLIFFGCEISKFTVTSGGKGQAYKYSY